MNNEDKKKLIIHKISIIDNQLQDMRNDINELKVLSDEIKKLIMSLINEKKEVIPDYTGKKGWFWN